MSDIAIRARGLSKFYRLYEKPGHRLLDLFGLLRAPVSEHRALSEIDLDIRRGEKVGIIGRNGAGKSTLLKLITRVIEPSAGTLEITGETRALLQIGTGFHPDFTGRQNIESYFAQIGIPDARAKEMVEDVIEFAELEEYIDQPVKTYSTGMGMRLMFAASTMIVPDLLVIDEVLGVGDAYFQHKSYERVRELCSGNGTTLLLVTHDVYSASQICDRMIWIDRGRILIDAQPSVVVKAYEESIREQEEQRLRTRKLGRVGEAPVTGGTERLLVELRAEGNRPQPSPIRIARLALAVGGTQVGSLPLGDDGFQPGGPAHLQREGSNWGEPQTHHGRLTRALLNYGSPFQKVSGSFDYPSAAATDEFGVIIDYWMDEPCTARLSIHQEGRETDLGFLPKETGRWVRHEAKPVRERPTEEISAGATGIPCLTRTEIEIPETEMHQEPEPVAALAVGELLREDEESTPGPAEPAVPSPIAVEPATRMVASVNTSGMHGTGCFRLIDLTCHLADGRETYVLPLGGAVEFRIRYKIVRPDLHERAQVILTFKRDGVTDVFRLFTRELEFDSAAKPEGTIAVSLERLPLAPGSYSLTLLIAREGYYDSRQTTFFSINPGVYFAHAGVAEIKVEGDHQVYSGTAVVGDADWSLR